MKRKIVFLTGTRADFGKLKPLINKVENSKEFECYIFVTGMHTLSKYGSSYHEVKKMGYKHIFIYMNQTTTTDMDLILSNTIVGFGNFVKEIKPDLIVVHGDRLETLAGAIVGSFNNIRVAHISGGDVSGTIDESIRHSTSKLSHFHFVHNEAAKRRIIQMGEKEESIFIIGDPAIDIMKSENLPKLKEVYQRYGLSFNNYSIFIFHPVTTETNKLQNHIRTIIESLIESKRNYVVIYPNNDLGSDIIINEIEKLRNNKNFAIYHSLRFEHFLSLLKNANFIIGNSSCGILEAEIFGTPSINIGSRQKNRTNSKNVWNCPIDKECILDSINHIKDIKMEPTSNFGKGNSTELFYNVLCDKKLWEINIQKQFIDRW